MDHGEVEDMGADAAVTRALPTLDKSSNFGPWKTIIIKFSWRRKMQREGWFQGHTDDFPEQVLAVQGEVQWSCQTGRGSKVRPRTD
jgi:hypothetical protein